MKNKEIAQLFREIAELLSFTDENPFRIRAYEKAAQTIESLPQPIEDVSEKDELQKLPGIGSGIAEKIKEYLSTSKISYLDELKKKIPSGLSGIIDIPGMGPKKAKLIYEKLGISNVQDLKKAAEEKKLRDLPGFGEKTEENILHGITFKEQASKRILLYDAMVLAKEIIADLKKLSEIKQISPAGSLRRRKETIGDIDILCAVEKGQEDKVIDRFIQLPQVKEKLSAGETKSSVITTQNIQVDLRVVEPDSYGAALQYFTGSKQHNITLRELANKKGLTINEYGVFKINQKSVLRETTKDEAVAGKTEEEVYNSIGLQYIPPTLREDSGEIQASLDKQLPELVEEQDLRGDMHVHSNYSDGVNTIEQIAQKAKSLGWDWVIICDHSQSLKVAHGVAIKDVHQKIDEIQLLNTKIKGIKILAGTEVDILSDGTLDYPDEILKLFDFVIAAIHTGFKQNEDQITQRVTKAMENKYVNSISHPTGRLLTKRDAYSINMEKVLAIAQQTGTCLEINAHPERLDLTDIYCRKAKEMGIKVTIGSDAHQIDQMKYLPLGIYVAQRGWLEKNNVVNCLTDVELMPVLKTKK